MHWKEGKLIADAQLGAPEAISELFRRHWPRVWRAAYSVCGRREMANDVAQDAMIRGIMALHKFERGRQLGPWLTRIAVNAAIDELRAERRLISEEDAEAPSVEVDWPLDDGLTRAVARLPDDKRLMVVLHYWLDYETAEIAELLGIPRGTVASRLSRALGDLRVDLEAKHV
jgi:RNA polymerase sigma-70 factor (ECF subfamily)